MDDAETAIDLLTDLLDRYNAGESRVALLPNVKAALAAARADERAKVEGEVVAWLMDFDGGSLALRHVPYVLRTAIATGLERGQHRPAPAGGTNLRTISGNSHIDVALANRIMDAQDQDPINPPGKEP